MIDPASSTTIAAKLRRNEVIFGSFLVLLLLASIPLHLGNPTSDVSWLISMCERILAGEVAYIDILETTPPVPALLYMPAVLLGRAIGISPEAALVITVYLSGLIALALVVCILPTDSKDRRIFARAFMFAAIVILFVLPADTFAQREYFAAMFGLPIITVFIRHAQTGEWPSIPIRTAAVILAALTVAIKMPVLAVPGLFILAYYRWQTGSFLYLIPSGIIYAGLLSGLMTAVSLVWFPDYLGQVWTLMRDVYVPAKGHPMLVLNDRAAMVAIVAFFLTVLMQIGRRHSAGIWLLLAGGLGYLVVYFMQGKFFSYHAYPAALMNGLAFFIAVVTWIYSFQSSDRVFKLANVVVLALVSGIVSVVLYQGLRDTRPRLNDLSWADKHDRSTVLAVSSYIATSFPLIRQFNGVWVNRTHSQWVARYTRAMLSDRELPLERRQLLQRYFDDDLLWIFNRIKQEKPELILVNMLPKEAWLLSELKARYPDVLAGYSTIAEEAGVRVMQHNAP